MRNSKHKKHKRSKQKSKLGLAPGSLVFTGQQKMSEVDITVINYSGNLYTENKAKNVGEAISLVKTHEGVSWVNIDGLHDEKYIEEICSFIGVHKLSMEDILSVGQRPKLEEYTDYLQATIKLLEHNNENDFIEYEQVSFILKKNVLVTFQEKTGDVFNGVRNRIKEGKGLIRKRGGDYLLYALLDLIVDHYFIIVDSYSEKLEDLETELLDNPDKNSLNKLHRLRRETLLLRRTIYPMREMISKFEKLDEPIINSDIKVFIRDLYDHTIKVIENIDVLRDMSSGLIDLYMNSASYKMNEIMKVLTIMSAIFIPITFIAGLYGMNFVNMPELHQKNGYFIILGVMLVVLIGMLIFLKRKKWI